MRCAAPVGRRQRARVVFCACPLLCVPIPGGSLSPTCAVGPPLAWRQLVLVAHELASLNVSHCGQLRTVALRCRCAPHGPSRWRALSWLRMQQLPTGHACRPSGCTITNLLAPRLRLPHPRTRTLLLAGGCVSCAPLTAAASTWRPASCTAQPWRRSTCLGRASWTPKVRTAPLACLQLASPLCCWHLSSVLTAPRAWSPCVRRP